MLSRFTSTSLRTFGGIRRVSSAITSLEKVVAEIPEKEIVRYTDKNLKWTLNQFKNYAEAHVNSMTEHGFTKGDTLALWLPESAEKHVILTAALQGGWKVVDIDTKINSVPELREALKAASDAGASSLYFFPQKDVDHILLLRKSIPEFFHFDDTAGHYFHSKHFPSLKLFIQCGLQNETGCVNFRELFLPTSSFVEAKKGDVKETDVAYEAITLDGGKVKKTKALTYGEVLTSSNYKFLDKILKKEYAEY